MMTSTQRHLYLTGFMGSGKSAVGRLVAEALNRPFYDLDTVVESLAGQSVNTIFAGEGEAAFRNYESRALRAIVSGSPSVIALGGGAPTVRSIAQLVRYTGRTVWLTADWTVVWERIRSDSTRPLLVDVLKTDGTKEPTSEQFIERGKELMATREPAYQALADWSLDTTNMTADQAAARIVEMTGAASR